MARTVKVTKEKVMRERAQEAGDRKRKQLKAIRDEKLEKQRKIQRGMQALREI